MNSEGDSTKSTATQTDAQVAIDSNQFLHSRGLLDLTYWKVKDMCFGDLRRGPYGDTLLPAGLLEDVVDNMKKLAKGETFVTLY